MSRTRWTQGLSLGSKLLAGASLLLPAGTQAANLLPADAPASEPAATQRNEAQSWRFHDNHVLGTSFDMVAVSADEATAREALAVVRAEIDRLDRVLSTYRADSEISALNQCAQMSASVDLFHVINACEQWRSTTQGAFSARLGTALALWRDATGSSAADTQAIAAAVAQAESAEVGLDPATRTITRPDAVVFAVDALAKGYIIDRALAAARQQVEGLDGLLVDIGGDVASWGRAPAVQGWQLGVAQTGSTHDNGPLAAVVQTGNGALATSGRGQRDMLVGSQAHSHLLSPANGQPVTDIHAATVLAANAAEADALATALSVMSVDEGMALIDSLPGTAALLQTASGEHIASSAWAANAARRETLAPRFIRTADAAATPWPANFAVSIDYEIPKIEADNYKAPFVAIWITDANRGLVRNLTHLGNQEKWIDSNYVWWRRYGRKIDKLDAVTKPTRKPGKYSLAWDGRDETGKPVGQGKYLVHVEASREHGGHTYQTFELNLGAKAFSQPQPAKEEIGALNLRFGQTS